MSNKKTFAVVLSFLIIVVLCVFVVLVQKEDQQVFVPIVGKSITTTPQPKKTDFGTKVPTDFPSDIPIEKGATIDESYGINYTSQKQLTIVFFSTKTVKENYALYTDFLKKQNWQVSNKYESTQVSSLYAAKELNDINITISESTSTHSVKSWVSISVLKK